MGINGVYCLNADTGDEIWRYVFERPIDFHSPTIDGKYVYGLNRVEKLFCLNTKNGKLLWEVVWSSDKPPEDLRVYSSNGIHYATPVIYDYEGKRYAVITCYLGIHSVDVETGKVLWLYNWEPFINIRISDPLIIKNKVFIAQYNRRGSILLDIIGGEPKVLWENMNLSSHVSSPVLVDGYIYGCESVPEMDYSSLRCLDSETGELMWEEELKLMTKSASLMAADGKLIILEDDGTLYIAEATPVEYKEISSGDVLGGEEKYRKFWISPVLYKSKIYFRN
jgi:outer membrane protein assembly factor BamB